MLISDPNQIHWLTKANKRFKTPEQNGTLLEREGRAGRVGDNHDNVAQAEFDQNIIYRCEHTLIKAYVDEESRQKKGGGRKRKNNRGKLQLLELSVEPQRVLPNRQHGCPHWRVIMGGSKHNISFCSPYQNSVFCRWL